MTLVDPLNKAEKPKKEVASSSPNLCPVCGAEMKPVLARGVSSVMCATHNIVMPKLNEA
jgi:hypothetical protein